MFSLTMESRAASGELLSSKVIAVSESAAQLKTYLKKDVIPKLSKRPSKIEIRDWKVDKFSRIETLMVVVPSDGFVVKYRLQQVRYLQTLEQMSYEGRNQLVLRQIWRIVKTELTLDNKMVEGLSGTMQAIILIMANWYRQQPENGDTNLE